MIYKHALLALDLSDDYTYLTYKAQDIVSAFQSRFSIITIIPSEVTFSSLLSLSYGNSEVTDRVHESMKKFLMNISLLIEDYQLIKGNPKMDVLNYIKEKQIDLVLLGNQKNNQFMKLLMGPTADSIVKNSICDIIFITD